MDTRYNKEEEEDEGITLDSETSTPDPPNPDQVIDSDDETKTTEKLLEDYYKAKIDHNHPRLGTAKVVHFFYTHSHLSALQNCALIFSANFQYIFTFKYRTIQFSH